MELIEKDQAHKLVFFNLLDSILVVNAAAKCIRLRKRPSTDLTGEDRGVYLR